MPIDDYRNAVNFCIAKNRIMTIIYRSNYCNQRVGLDGRSVGYDQNKLFFHRSLYYNIIEGYYKS